jgi:hypothetical protein
LSARSTSDRRRQRLDSLQDHGPLRTMADVRDESTEGRCLAVQRMHTQHVLFQRRTAVRSDCRAAAPSWSSSSMLSRTSTLRRSRSRSSNIPRRVSSAPGANWRWWGRNPMALPDHSANDGALRTLRQRTRSKFGATVRATDAASVCRSRALPCRRLPTHCARCVERRIHRQRRGSSQSAVVLVGHSYGSRVITNAANGLASVKALVFISAFIPAARAAIEETVSKPLAQGPAPREPAQAG